MNVLRVNQKQETWVPGWKIKRASWMTKQGTSDCCFIASLSSIEHQQHLKKRKKQQEGKESRSSETCFQVQFFYFFHWKVAFQMPASLRTFKMQTFWTAPSVRWNRPAKRYSHQQTHSSALLFFLLLPFKYILMINQHCRPVSEAVALRWGYGASLCLEK